MKIFTRSVLFSVLLLTAAPALAQQNAANFETRLSTLEDEMRVLNGQMEQITYSIRRLDQTLQRMQGDEDARFNKIETTLANLTAGNEARTAVLPPSTAPSAPLPPSGPVDGTLGALKTQPDGHVVGAINSPKAPPLPDVQPSDVLTPQEQYDDAFGLLRQANYEEAEKAFKDFIDKNPKDKMIDNAKYWHAETLYVRGRFSEAAIGFADAYQQNPLGAKAPDSLLKLSMTLAALNKPVDACTSLAALKSKYPNATQLVKNRAAEERQKLKCS
jgi:tol-pal system protein YbgF